MRTNADLLLCATQVGLTLRSMRLKSHASEVCARDRVSVHHRRCQSLGLVTKLLAMFPSLPGKSEGDGRTHPLVPR